MVGGAFTVSTKLLVAVNPPPSVTVSEMVARPLCPVAGVTVTVRAAPVPPTTIFAVGTNVLLLETPAIVNEVSGVKSSPTVNGNAAVEVPALISTFAILVMDGGALTVSTKLLIAVNPALSDTVNLIVTVPVLPVTGVTVTVREAPAPPKTILALGTIAKLLDAPVSVSALSGVIMSPTIKESAVVDALRLIICGVIAVMVGRFTVSVKLVFAVNPMLSVTVSVIVDIPLYVATGVTISIQLPLLLGPVSDIPATLTNAVLLDAHVTVNAAAADWPSPTVNANAAVDVPILISWLGIMVIVGQ